MRRVVVVLLMMPNQTEVLYHSSNRLEVRLDAMASNRCEMKDVGEHVPDA